MSVVWSGVTESGAVVPVQVDGLGRVIATTGDPPGPPVIEYNGASAWGDVGADGKLKNGLNIASVRNNSDGIYDVVFTTPMATADYSITGSTANTSDGFLPLTFQYLFQTAQGFRATLKYEDVNGNPAYYSNPFSFAVYSINALPPQGGTGADAWSLVSSDATILGSFNIATVTKISDGGRYQYTFTSPMPDGNYAVLATVNSNSQPKASAYVYNKDANGFEVQTFIENAGVNAAHAIAVHATNATLPLTVTAEQIGAVINNWQKTADTLSTKDAVEMNGPVRFAGGKAGVTSTGEFYFTSGTEKYLIGIEEGQMRLKRIDSVY